MTPSIKQMRVRMNSGHLAWLKALHAGTKPVAHRSSEARGLMTARGTLISWGAIDGDRLTPVGEQLLGLR